MTEQTTINVLACIASWGNHGMVALPDNRLLPVQYQRRIGRPLCGDKVDIEQQSDRQWLVTRIYKRDTFFARADRFGRQQMIAANMNQALVIIAPEPSPSRDLIDRYLCANEILGIKTVLVLNKIDLTGEKLAQLRQQLTDYKQLGYQVIECSASTGAGIDDLQQQLSNQDMPAVCSLLIGQSGVGKSSLLNSLIADLSVQTNSLSSATGKGKHTTTIAHMYMLADQKNTIIDTPGVWEYGLWQMPPGELAHAFREFREWLGKCRFHDCQHAGEPGCALQQQADQSPEFSRRWRCYQRLLVEQKRFDS